MMMAYGSDDDGLEEESLAAHDGFGLERRGGGWGGGW